MDIRNLAYLLLVFFGIFAIIPISSRTLLRTDGQAPQVNSGIAATQLIECFGDSAAKEIIMEGINSDIPDAFKNNIWITCDSVGRVLRSGAEDKKMSWLPFFHTAQLDSLVRYMAEHDVRFWHRAPRSKFGFKNFINEIVKYNMEFPIIIRLFYQDYVSKELYNKYCKDNNVNIDYYEFYKLTMDSLAHIPVDSVVESWGFYN